VRKNAVERSYLYRDERCIAGRRVYARVKLCWEKTPGLILLRGCGDRQLVKSLKKPRHLDDWQSS
jgi:hypothetical protein